MARKTGSKKVQKPKLRVHKKTVKWGNYGDRTYCEFTAEVRPFSPSGVDAALVFKDGRSTVYFDTSYDVLWSSKKEVHEWVERITRIAGEMVAAANKVAEYVDKVEEYHKQVEKADKNARKKTVKEASNDA